MDLRTSSKLTAYAHRPRILFAAVLFPLPLLLSAIGDIRLDGLDFGNGLRLLACVGIYISLITFLWAPIRFWWALRLALGIIAATCFAWFSRGLATFFHSGSFDALASILTASIGLASLIAACRPRPNRR